MKNILSVILVFSIVFISLNCNPQKDKPAETPKVKENMQGNTFSGSLVDSKCFSMMPKMNAGNEHTVMGPKGRWVEVQIRSNRMNEIAEKGYAAHYKYKEGKTKKDDTLDDWINKLQEALENPDTNAVDFVEEFKLNLYSKEIFVFIVLLGRF